MAAEGLPSPAEFAALRAAFPGFCSAEDRAVVSRLVRAWAAWDVDALRAEVVGFVNRFKYWVRARPGHLLLIPLAEFEDGNPILIEEIVYAHLAPAGYPVKTILGHCQELIFLVQLPEARPSA